jgi:hypothetical protein
MIKLKKISFTYILVCLLMLALFASCKKEYSYEGGLQAQYVVEGSPADCSPSVLSGFYIEGTAVGTGNTLQITVDVSRAGNYTIYTLPNDGVSFTASGNFADTGTQVVTLQGSGTPDTVGIFTLKIPGEGGCTILLNVMKKAPASYTLAGYPNDCTNPVIGGIYSVGTSIKPGNNVTLQVIVNTPGDYSISTDTLGGISFSASGHFTTSGAQTVILECNGLPENPGLFYFNVKADSSSCSFSVPVQSGEPLATYVLQSGIGPSGLVCSPQSIQGTYTAGVLLNSSNTITITPYATLPGNYTISTNRLNGVIFSASGNFPTSGTYSVLLTGNGTPMASGTFSFTPQIIGPSPLGGASCDVSVSVQ